MMIKLQFDEYVHWQNGNFTKQQATEMKNLWNRVWNKLKVNDLERWRSSKLMNCQVDKMATCQNSKLLKWKIDEAV